MMAAAKKGHLKKKRSDPTRNRRPDPNPDPPPPPPETRRSLRPRHRRFIDIDDYDDEEKEEEEDDDDEEESESGVRRRKLKLVLKLPPFSSPVTAAPKSRRHVSPPDCSSSSSHSRYATSSSDEYEDEEIVQPLKKRRIERVQDSSGSGHRLERKRTVLQRPIRAVLGTPMPESRVLEPILDKLQKKDIYGVFAQPVDPEELPDYHDVIEHPMDFGTVRRKLASGRYRSFKQFEDDVYLICSNAMQYNAPDTIYFRQACSIQDMARKYFQEIRAGIISSGVASKSEEKNKSGSNEKKTVKKFQSGTAPKPFVSGISSTEKKTPKQPDCRGALEPISYNNSFMEKKSLKNPLCRVREPLGFHISFAGKKTMKKPQYRTAHEPQESDLPCAGKKISKKFQFITTPKHQGSDVSSIEMKKLNKPGCRTAREPLRCDNNSMEKKKLKKLQYRIKPEPLLPGTYLMEKTIGKKPRQISESEPLGSDTSSMEKKAQKKHQSRTAPPESLNSDTSSGATLATVADAPAVDAFNMLSNIPANGDAKATDPCTGLSTACASSNALGDDACTGLYSEQGDGVVDRSATVNGSFDLSSSLGESKSEKADDVPAKCSPSKLGMKPFVVDINRRETYNTLDQQPMAETDSVFDVFEGETRQLSAVVGLHSEHSYSRSLARFAASLGPIAWEIASKRIEQALPTGVKFGPGWVGEYEPLPTPVLSVANNTQKLRVTKKNKVNETKSRAISAVSRKDKEVKIRPAPTSAVSRNDKGNEIMSEVTRSGQWKDMPFGIISDRAHNSANEGNGRTREHKQGLFGVNLKHKLGPKNQPTGDSVKSCTKEESKPTFPAMISNGRRIQAQPEPQKSQQPIKQVACDFAKGYTNETIRNRPELFSAISNPPTVSCMGRNQMQIESQRRNDGIAMIPGGLSNWRGPDGSIPNAPFGIIANHQGGVRYWFARGSQEQAINDPLRWMSSSGKISNPLNTLSRCSTNIEHSAPTVHIPITGNPNSAQTWMSVGASGGWKSVDGGGISTKQVRSASSRLHEDIRIKSEVIQGVSENSLAQPKGLVIFPQLMTNDVSRLQNPWQGTFQQNRPKDTLPPDLNISFQPPGSPARSSSGMHIDSQQPDLALQL